MQHVHGQNTKYYTIQDELSKNGSPNAVIETDDERSYFLIEIPFMTMCL